MLLPHWWEGGLVKPFTSVFPLSIFHSHCVPKEILVSMRIFWPRRGPRLGGNCNTSVCLLPERTNA